jgi:hypothetical protein
MSESKVKKIRQLTRYRVSDDPIRGKDGSKRKYARSGARRIDTGAGKTIIVGGNLVNIGVRALYKTLLKSYKQMSKAERRSYFRGQM